MPGMRKWSEVYIFVDLEKAMNAGLEFFLSMNGVVLTRGDESGFLSPSFFSRVERRDHQSVKGWEGLGPIHFASNLLEAKVDDGQAPELPDPSSHTAPDAVPVPAVQT